ncbi:histidine kinase [Pontibacter sp. JH31]|uniref:Histidine kinase n=1 Tax=Pontibacter aquaedesilientis TaxID=2766980 RepID=A0ABR7XIN2_9BACT|nr:histidine kinase [Pontibacter aquaedesilientis]MBD1398163.1 histidine kinase [Pontibacter aquaedesilientis]
MIEKQNYYIKELIIVAFITSILFGGFGALNTIVASNLMSFRPPRPEGSPLGMRPMGQIYNSLVMVGLMFTLWVMNIALYARFQKFAARENVKQIVRYSVSYVATFVLISLYFVAITQIIPNPRYGRAFFIPLVAAFTNNTIVLIILDLVVLQKKKAQIELENAKLKTNSLQAQHQQLKHQLQPHFLFNALNTLKLLIKRHPAEAQDYVIRLSEFLRATITTDSQDTITLKEELKLCVDYLEMQRVRFKNAFSYTLEIPEELLESAYLPVFSLQLLAENAMKHNSFTQEKTLHITIAYSGDGCIRVSNNRQPKNVRNSSSGIGLKNLSERYRVLADKELSIFKTEDVFSVHLPILYK